MSLQSVPKKLTPAEQIEFDKLWPEKKEKLEARRAAGDFGLKKLKSKMFFAKLELVRKIRNKIGNESPLP